MVGKCCSPEFATKDFEEGYAESVVDPFARGSCVRNFVARPSARRAPEGCFPLAAPEWLDVRPLGGFTVRDRIPAWLLAGAPDRGLPEGRGAGDRARHQERLELLPGRSGACALAAR